MSKFYYSGKIQQENYLTNKDNLLREVYGKYQLILTEAFLFLFFALFAILASVFKLENYLAIPYFYSKILGITLIVLALVFELTYRFVLKKKSGRFLRPRIIAYVILGLILVFVPNSLDAFVYRLLTFFFITVGFISLMRKHKSSMQMVVSFGMIVIGFFFFLFPHMNNYKDLVFFTLIGVLGIYLLYHGFDFRKRFKPYEDEQKGFTDYKIEN